MLIMIRRNYPFLLLLLLIFISFGISQSSFAMMKNPCGNNMPTGHNAAMAGKKSTLMNKLINRSTLMKIHRLIPFEQPYIHAILIMPFFYKTYPGAHLIFMNSKILKLNSNQIKQEAMIVKKVLRESVPLLNTLNKSRKMFYMEVLKNNPSKSKLIKYEKIFENTEKILGEKIISAHIDAIRILTAQQKNRLRKMLINWPVVNVSYPVYP